MLEKERPVAIVAPSTQPSTSQPPATTTVSTEVISEEPLQELPPSDFYSFKSQADIPLPPFPDSRTYPKDVYSNISSTKAQQFIMGQMKFFVKGLTKQADVPVDDRSEIQEYNVARRLRGNQLDEVQGYIKQRGWDRAQQDFCIGLASLNIHWCRMQFTNNYF